MNDHVILVDADDREIGTAEKLRAHREGLLHRAFSVYVFNRRGEMLLQQRHADKYHSGGLWSNACCSHPRPGEDVVAAGVRRLEEEMGVRCDLEAAFRFTYRVALGDLWEHEVDHVLLGFCDGVSRPDETEVAAWRWVPIARLEEEVARRPEAFTHWFLVSYRRAIEEAAARMDAGFAGR